MWRRKVIYLRPDVADLVGLTAIEADSFIEDQITRRFLLNVVEVMLRQVLVDGCVFRE